MSVVVSMAVFPVPRPAAGRSWELVVAREQVQAGGTQTIGCDFFTSLFATGPHVRAVKWVLPKMSTQPRAPRARMSGPGATGRSSANAVMLDGGHIHRSCHRHAPHRLSRPISAYSVRLADVRAVHFVWRGDQDNRKHSHTAPHRCNCERRNEGQKRARQPNIHHHFRPELCKSTHGPVVLLRCRCLQLLQRWRESSRATDNASGSLRLTELFSNARGEGSSGRRGSIAERHKAVSRSKPSPAVQCRA